MQIYRLLSCNIERQKAQGFTLLELLVVIVIIAIATSLIVVQGVPSNLQYVRQEAKKLSQILWIAQQEAKLTNQTLRLSTTAEGFEFLYQAQEDEWQTYNKEKRLRPRNWDTEAINVVVIEDDLRTAFIEITPKPHLKNQQILISLKEAKIVLKRSFTGRFQFVEEEQNETALMIQK